MTCNSSNCFSMGKSNWGSQSKPDRVRIPHHNDASCWEEPFQKFVYQPGT
uniref:Uncharacterized protein n=1 Tax=Arundo donax TaxID=35708 RepID=A0A0A9D3N0_ARUDO